MPITITEAAGGTFNVFSQSFDGARGSIADSPIGDLAGGPASMSSSRPVTGWGPT